MSIEEFPQTGEDFEKLFDRKAFGDMLHSDYDTYTVRLVLPFQTAFTLKCTDG